MDKDKVAQTRKSGSTLTAIAITSALVAYVWISLASERNTLRLEIKEQGKQLALSLEDAIDVVRSHAFVTQKAVEHALERSGGVNKNPEALIKSESATLFVDPKAVLEPEDFLLVLSSATKMLPTVAATHQWNPIFQWTYFYDAGGRWLLNYPYLSVDELFRSTKTGDLSNAIRAAFDADGTHPVELAGPRHNPKREMLWTRSYEDAFGKGRMVTLLAPVYQGDRYVGAIGTDITLSQLDTVLHNHAPEVGRALVVNDNGTVLADSSGALQSRSQPLKIGEIYPQFTNQLPDSDPAWQRLPLKGSLWTLWVHIPDADLNRAVIDDLTPSFIMAGLVFLALLGLLWVQQRRRADSSATEVTLEETRSALVRADRLGAMGGLISSVGREIESSLHKATRAISGLQSGLGAFQEQQQRGLRRAELEEFVARVADESRQAARQIEEADELLQRFRQLATEQTSEGERSFNLAEVAGNVLAVLGPALKRQNCSAENAIPADMQLKADPGALSQTLHYLVNDVLKRSQPGQSLGLTAGWNTGGKGELVEITLTDKAGIPPDMSSENLVLAVRSVQQILGGELVIEPVPGGNCMIVRIPV